MTDPAVTPMRAPSVVALLVASIALCAIASAAALNGVNTQTLTAGASSVGACDGDGFTVTQTIVVTTVTALTIGDVHGDCAGGEMTVVLTDGTGAVVSTAGPATVVGGSVAVALSPSVATTAFTDHRVRIVGP